jgi:hypothetical protein
LGRIAGLNLKKCPPDELIGALLKTALLAAVPLEIAFLQLPNLGAALSLGTNGSSWKWGIALRDLRLLSITQIAVTI